MAMDVDQATGGTHPAALGNVFKGLDGQVLTQLHAEERRPLALGKARFAGATVEHPQVVVFAVVEGDGQIFQAAFAIIGALGILATEFGQVFHGEASKT